jgi:hypothetical protein
VINTYLCPRVGRRLWLHGRGLSGLGGSSPQPVTCRLHFFLSQAFPVLVCSRSVDPLKALPVRVCVCVNVYVGQVSWNFGAAGSCPFMNTPSGPDDYLSYFTVANGAFLTGNNYGTVLTAAAYDTSAPSAGYPGASGVCNVGLALVVSDCSCCPLVPVWHENESQVGLCQVHTSAAVLFCLPSAWRDAEFEHQLLLQCDPDSRGGRSCNREHHSVWDPKNGNWAHPICGGGLGKRRSRRHHQRERCLAC